MNDLYDLLEEYRIDDEKMAIAYEAISPACKALIKTAIALSDFQYGHSSLYEDRFCSNPELGFWKKSCSSPVKHCFLLVEADYPAMARLCAAAVLPKLAGVKNIYAIIPDNPPSYAILATLELCGMENIFIVPENKIFALLASPLQDTRIMGLHGQTIFKLIRPLADMGFIFFYEYAKPRIAVLNPEEFSTREFIFALGLSPSEVPYKPGESYDAVYLDNRERFTDLPDNAQMALTPGCECFWQFPALNPAFFQRNRHLFGFYKGEDNNAFHTG